MGYAVTKNSLKALNVFYLVVAIIMIAVAGAAKGMAELSSAAIAGGVIACGVFLMLVSVLGFVGAHLHHQVMLFVYMIVLALIFIIQFSVSIACLAVSTSQQHSLVQNAWYSLSPASRVDIQYWGTCCGFSNSSGPYYYEMNGKFNFDSNYLGPVADAAPSVPRLCPCSDGSNSAALNNPVCEDSINATVPISGQNTRGPNTAGTATSCLNALESSLDKAFKAAGGVGLFFSFTEVLGILAAAKFRTSLKQQANYA